MKVLNNSQLNNVNGGWMAPAAAFVAGSFGGWALGEYVFSPVRDKFVESIKKESEGLVNDFKNDKDKFAKEHFSFHGDM